MTEGPFAGFSYFVTRDADTTEIPVPEGVQGVIAARLDTLRPDRKALMHDAAVVGKVFWAGALASMARVSTTHPVASPTRRN